MHVRVARDAAETAVAHLSRRVCSPPARRLARVAGVDESPAARRRCSRCEPMWCRLAVLAAVVHHLGVCDASSAEDFTDPPVSCRIEEATCRGGVLIDGQCWRVGAQGQSCADVCSMAEQTLPEITPVRERFG